MEGDAVQAIVKKTWQKPALRSEEVQETLAQPACRIKASIVVRGPRGRGATVQAAFS